MTCALFMQLAGIRVISKRILKEMPDREPSEGIYSACVGNPVTAYAWILLGRCVCNGVWCGGDVWGC